MMPIILYKSYGLNAQVEEVRPREIKIELG